jgi:3-hydroxymyristoyl/3-hydroxydecanoyl-(acyl carrier protein) dehydratase
VRFVDQITLDPSGGTSRASLTVDSAAEYLTDHFPGAPTLPGLVMLESAVRAAAALWDAAAPDARGHAAALEHVERLQIVRRVVPGETLIVDAHMESDGERGAQWFAARASVDGETAMRARFRLTR